MSPEASRAFGDRHAQRGVSLVFALFILLGLTALGGFLISLITQTNTGRAQDLLGYQAREAAVAGIEYGAYRWVVNGACAGETLTLGAFQVVVSCTPSDTTTANNVDGTLVRARLIAATACPVGGTCPNISTPGPGYVERRLEAVVTR